MSDDGSPQLGFDASGAPVFGPYRPTVRSLADRITGWLRPGVDLLDVIPVPSGFSFARGSNLGKLQLQLTLDGAYARRYRWVFGYVGDIQLAVEARGTATPTQLTIVAMIPWRYGNDAKIETEDSFIFCRIDAFASKALLTIGGRILSFPTPIFASDPAVIIRVGDPVSGFLEPSPGDSKSAQLTGWGKLMSPPVKGLVMKRTPLQLFFSSISFGVICPFSFFRPSLPRLGAETLTTFPPYPSCQRRTWCMRGRRA